MPRYRVMFTEHTTFVHTFESTDEDSLQSDIDSFDWDFADAVYTDEDWDVEELDCE